MRPSTRTQRFRWQLLIGLLLVGGLIAGIALVALRPAAPSAPALVSQGDCRSLPQFVAGGSLGFAGQVTASTADRTAKGLVLFDSARPGQAFQHPDGSWDDAGYIGAFAYDADGNIYLAPTPRVSLVENPPAGQNTLWRIATDTGHMAPFVALPSAAPTNERNPFGVMGLSYDCHAGSVYAASVAGSTPSQELGQILRVPVATGQPSIVLAPVDAMGLAVVRLGDEQRLFFGLAREGAVWSVALDATGQAVGEAQRAFDLSLVGGLPSERVRKIDVVDGALRMTLVPFAFTLQAGSEDRQRRASVRPEGDGWAVVEQATSAPPGP